MDEEKPVQIADVLDRIPEMAANPEPLPAELAPESFRLPAKATTYAERERNRVDVAFIQECGRLNSLKTALAQSNSPKMVALFIDLANPESRNFTISELAKHHKITALELAELMRDYNRSKTILNMLAEMPEVGKDVVNDAKSTHVSCRRCDGLGTIETRETTVEVDENGREREKPVYARCPECKGRGVIRKSGDLAARKLAFEATGLITKQPLVAIDQRQVTIESTLGELEGMDA